MPMLQRDLSPWPRPTIAITIITLIIIVIVVIVTIILIHRHVGSSAVCIAASIRAMTSAAANVVKSMCDDLNNSTAYANSQVSGGRPNDAVLAVQCDAMMKRCR